MTDRLTRLIRDLEAHGARFLLVESQIEVEGIDLEPWFSEWIEKNGRELRQILRGKPPESPQEPNPAP